MKNKTFVGRLLQDIVGLFGSIFSHVLKGAEKTYNDLPEETQDALLHGSGVIAFITKEAEAAPGSVAQGILAEYPDLNIDSLTKGLLLVAQAFKLDVDENSIDDIIAKLQAYLASLQGDLWDIIVQGAANILAVFLAPKGTKVGVITTLMEYVYQTFLKKKKK